MALVEAVRGDLVDAGRIATLSIVAGDGPLTRRRRPRPGPGGLTDALNAERPSNHCGSGPPGRTGSGRPQGRCATGVLVRPRFRACTASHELLPDGVARRDDLDAATSSSSVGRWLARGDLVLLHPGVVDAARRAPRLGRPRRSGVPLVERSAQPPVRADGGGPRGRRRPVRCTSRCPSSSAPRGGRRRRRAPVDAAAGHDPLRTASTVTRSVAQPRGRLGLGARADAATPTPSNEAAVVRQAVIEGVRRGAVRAATLRAESDRRPLHAGRQTLRRPAGPGRRRLRERTGDLGRHDGPARAARGCRRGCSSIRFASATAGRVRLDAAYPDARVAVELDGAAFHGSREARERDLRRDTRAGRARLGGAPVQLRAPDGRPGGLPARDRGRRPRRELANR